MIVFVSVSTRQAFFIIHPLVAFSFYTPSTCISLFLLSSHCEHFIPPKKKCNGIIKWQKTWSMFRACVVVISGKNLLLVFWGWQCTSVIVYYIHTYIYVSNRYHMYLPRLSTSWACSWNDEMLPWLFRWPPMATYIFQLSSLSFSSTEKQYCSTMMIDYWKVAVISDCLQHMLAISGKYQAVDGDILTCKKK